jgi:UrcA family protein
MRVNIRGAARTLALALLFSLIPPATGAALIVVSVNALSSPRVRAWERLVLRRLTPWQRAIVAGAVLAPIVYAFLILSGPAHPHRTLSVGSVVIDYSDLNVSTAPGADRLLRRIRRAAQQQCHAFRVPRRRSLINLDPCLRDAIEPAIDEVGSVVADRYRDSG